MELLPLRLLPLAMLLMLIDSESELQVGISIPRYQSSSLNKGRICTCKGM